MDPLVVTLAIDDESQARFDEERRRYFPAGRTQVGAHITLFHALPGEDLERVTVELHRVADRPAFDVTVTDVYSLGRGVAYRLSSPELDAAHAELRAAWVDLQTPQDAQTFRPHITVQNKVEPDQARATLAALSSSFSPCAVVATGLALWRYEGGPWAAVETMPFA